MRAELIGLKIQKLSYSFPLASALKKSPKEIFFILYVHITCVLSVVILGEMDLRRTLIICNKKVVCFYGIQIQNTGRQVAAGFQALKL